VSPVIDVELVTVHIAAATNGPFALIQDVESYDATHGSEGDTRRRVFGNATAYVRTGELTDEYDLSGLYNPNDTGGQNVLRAARDNRGMVWLAIMHGPATGYKQQCNVTEYSDSGDAGGEWIECDFSLSGTGPRVAVTAALP
jgi:hypothetical protein